MPASSIPKLTGMPSRIAVMKIRIMPARDGFGLFAKTAVSP